MKKILSIFVLCGFLNFVVPAPFVVAEEAPVTAPAPAATDAPVVTTETEAAPATEASTTAEPAKDEGSIVPTIFEGLHILLTILGVAIAALVVVLVKRVAGKFGIQLSDEQLNLAQRLAEQGIHYANSKAAAAAEKPAGQSKLKSAVDYIKSHPEFITLAKKYSDEKLVGLIESTLGQKKAEGHPV